TMEKGITMPLLKRTTLSAMVAIVVLLAGFSVTGAQTSEVIRASEKTSALATLGDNLVAPPCLFGATVLGWAGFTVSLPARALSGNIDQAAETLVTNPARSAFQRRLGCTPVQHEQRLYEKRTREMNRDQE